MAPVLSVVIVNWNQRELLDACLRSLADAADEVDGNVEVLVVDNGSEDDSRPFVREHHPHVRLIELPENRGFAGAVAVGMPAATAPLIMLLNNDATLERDALKVLLQTVEAHPEAGAFAAQMRFVGSDARINSAGIEIDRLGVVYDRHLGRRPEESDREPVEVFGASAGAAVYRRTMLDEIGGIEPGFFIYLEDADLAWRARAHGWRTFYVPGAVIHHHHSVAFGHWSERKYRQVGRNRVLLLARNMPSHQLRRALPGILAYDLAYVTFVAVRDRTLAPLHGRLAGLREWRAIRRAADPRHVPLPPAAGVRAALRRRRAWLADTGTQRM